MKGVRKGLHIVTIFLCFFLIQTFFTVLVSCSKNKQENGCYLHPSQFLSFNSNKYYILYTIYNIHIHSPMKFFFLNLDKINLRAIETKSINLSIDGLIRIIYRLLLFSLYKYFFYINNLSSSLFMDIC